MEFKVGDYVKVKEGSSSASKRLDGKSGTITEIGVNTGEKWCNLDISKDGDAVWLKEVELVISTGIPNRKMSKTKKVYNVLVVNKKTGKEQQKPSTVIADSEQQATLKAFGVDVDNLFIKVNEVGEYEEEKPVEVVSVDGKKN